MKAFTLNIILLVTALSPFDLSAQKKSIESITWNVVGKIPSDLEIKPIGLAGAISGENGGVLLVAGGSNFPNKMPWLGGVKKYYNQIHVYQRYGNSKALIPVKGQFQLPFNIAYSAVCSTDKGLILAGGENEEGSSNKVLMLTWKNKEVNINQLPNLPYAVSNASLCQFGDIIYLAGGEVDGDTAGIFLSLDLKCADQGWQKLANLPQKTSHTVLLSSVAQGVGEVFLIGGRKKNIAASSTIYNQVFAYNIQNDVWLEKQQLPYRLSAACGVSFGNELVVFSGDTGETFNKVENAILKIAGEKDPEKLSALNAEKINILSSHPGFTRGVLSYDIKSNHWRLLNKLLVHPPVTTNAVLWDDEIFIAGGEIRAGVRSADILSGKIK